MRWHALLWPLLAVLCAHPVLAQPVPDELDEGVVMETPFVVGVEGDKWEAGLLVGYLDLNHTLMGADNVIIDIETPDDLLFGNMKMEGDLGFTPKLMLNRSFGNHFVLENSLSFAFGSFSQKLSSGTQAWINPTSENTLTENEIESGSYFALIQDHSLTWFPRGEGRILPFGSVGAGTHWYELDSDYVAGGLHGGFGFSYGVGVRVVGDDLYSLRIEVRRYHSQVEFPVAKRWRNQQNIDGNAILDVPVFELVETSTLSEEEIESIYSLLELSDPGDGARPLFMPRLLDSFESENYTSLYFSIGFTAAF